jgi:hypothetical protein
MSSELNQLPYEQSPLLPQTTATSPKATTTPSKPYPLDLDEQPRTTAGTAPSRRQFLGAALAGLGTATLLSGCGESTAKPTSESTALPNAPAGVEASDAPEISELKIGMIALTDCSPIRHRARERASSRSTGSTPPS